MDTAGYLQPSAQGYNIDDAQPAFTSRQLGCLRPVLKDQHVQMINARTECRTQEAEVIVLAVNRPLRKSVSGLAATHKKPTACSAQFGNRALFESIQSKIDGLAKRRGYCHVGANTCVKLSCSLNGSVTWCNDGQSILSRPCRHIAKDAKRLMKRCKVSHPRSRKRWVRGQIRDSNQSRIVINKGECTGSRMVAGEASPGAGVSKSVSRRKDRLAKATIRS
jgi:hypothetical protein